MKKKFLQAGLALAALLLAVGLVGCPVDTPDDKKATKQSGAELQWVSIGTVEDTYPNESGTANMADVWAVGYDANEIALTNAQKSANIRYELASSSNKAKVEFAQIAASAQTSPSPTFTSPVGGRTFDDGDWLIVKVTSEDGKTTLYYRFNISLGKNAFLASVTIGINPQSGELYLGKPAATFDDIEIGDFQTDPNASKFLLLAQDEDAPISYAFVADAPTDLSASLTAFTGTDAIALPAEAVDGSYLIIKVESTSDTNKVTLYYIMKLIFPKIGTIKYGVPKLVDPVNPGTPFYIDPVWDTVEWEFDISRANQAESVGTYFKYDYGKHTTAKAKALWDDGGIWVLVDADVNPFSETQGGAQKDRPVTPASEHNGDSIEIFINERLQLLGTDAMKNASDVLNNNLGNQYRVGVNNDLSGETAAALTADNTNGEITLDGKPLQAPFNANSTYAKTRAALKTSTGTGIHTDIRGDFATTLVEAKNGGFMFIAYAPFKMKDTDNANAVFDAQGKVKANATIGFELQLNVNSGTGRDGILTWNGVNTASYNNASGYGVVSLVRDSKPEDTTVFPEITAQALSNGAYHMDDTPEALSVTSAGSTVTWYKAETPYGAGTSTNQTGNSYTPTLATEANYSYYYAIVTANGVSVVTSRRAQIRTYGENEGLAPPRIEPFTEKIVNISTAVPVYGFDIGDKKFSDITKAVVEIKLDPASAATSGRVRAWGSYASELDDEKTWNSSSVGMQNAVGTKLLNENGVVTILSDDFHSFDIAFTTAGFTAQATETGLLVLAIGIVPAGGSTGTYTYYMKNIKLVASDNTEFLAIHPEDTAVIGGMGKDAFVTQDFSGGQTATRQLIPFEEKIVNISTAVPVYGFDIGDKKFSDITKAVVDVLLDPASAATSGRVRAWGSYASEIADEKTWASNTVGMQNAVGTKLLNENGVVTILSDDFHSFDIAFTTAGFTAQATETGLLVLAIGIVPAGGSTGTYTYYMKNIKLVASDNTEFYAVHPASSLIAGLGVDAFVTQDFAGGQIVTRQLGPFDHGTPSFVAVSGITGIPTRTPIGTLPLNGTVAPPNATNKTIVWSTSTAGASITGGNNLVTTAAGQVTVTATITDGTEEGTDYTQNFTIDVFTPPTAWSTDTPANAGVLTPSTFGSATLTTISGNVASVSLDGTNTGTGFYYTGLPTNWLDYTSIKITYEAVITTSPAKVTVKKGANSWTDTTPAMYVDVTAGTASEWTWPIANFADATSAGFSLQVNNNSAGADQAQVWTFEAKKIELIP